MMRFLKTLRRDDRGAAIIELGIVAPILALITVGVVDMANGFATKLKLEQASQRAIEKIMQTTGNGTAEDTIIAEAATQAEVPVENVSVTYRLECDGTLQADPEGECLETQQTAKWVTVTVNDKYKPLFAMKMFKFSGLESDGTYHIQAKAGMRTQ
jgi:Flp pilus assembly protein TadG